MKIDYVQIVHDLYNELAKRSELFEQRELPPRGLFSPVKLEVHPKLWVRITSNIHNPDGLFTRSACLKVYDPSDQIGTEDGRVYLELQVLDSDDPDLANSLQLFLSKPGLGNNLDKIEVCRLIVIRIRKLVGSPIKAS